MKKFTIIMIAFIALTINANAQWTQYLTGQSSVITEFSVVNDNIIWATDVNSTLFSISLNGGANWQTKSFPSIITVDRATSGSNGNISAVSATTAFIVQSQGANKGVYKTIDSGNTWTRQSTAVFNNTSSFPDIIYFWNENEGVVVGDGLEIYTTTNGGNQWNPVSSANMPTGSNWTMNIGSAFKVLGNTIYVETGSGQIFMSTNKGLNWSTINTPLTSINYMSFDFKDVNNGLLSDYNPTTNLSTLYSTTNGGLSWTLVNTSSTNNYSNLKYLPSQNVYTNVCGAYSGSHGGRGLSYSTDNGQNWTQNPSFLYMQLGQIAYTPSGKIILGGNKYIYTSENVEGVNISVTDAKITGSNSMDITYSENPDPVSSLYLTNYAISVVQNKIEQKLNIQSLTQDATYKSIIHVLFQSNLPLDTIIVNIGNVKALNDITGFTVLSRDIVLYNYNTSKTIQVNTAGTLSSLLTAGELNYVTSLTVTGTIDARDFKTMRDNMPNLGVVDLSGTNIAEYTGTEGTYSTDITDYPVNTTPRLGFYNKKSLISAILPYTLTALGRSSFNSCSSLISINIPSLVTSIGYAEFNGCSSLSSVNIPSGVKLIDTYTFGSCTSLKSITIPSSVTLIGDFSFNNSGLTTITLPTGLNSIGQYAFQGCSALNYVTLPTGLNSIGQWAFNGCSSLNYVTIPSTVSTIGYGAFTWDNVLTSFQVANDNPYFSSLDGVLYDKPQKKLLCFPAGKSANFIIPPTVTVIDTAAFAGNWKLRSVTIPSTVTKLSQEAFNSCYLLAEINIPASITSIGGASFYNCYNLAAIFTNTTSPLSINVADSIFNFVNKTGCVLYVPSGAKAAYQSAQGWNEFNRIIEFVPTTDYDNNIYHGITIGTQTWLVENLKTTHYQNGDFIGTTSTPTLDVSSQTAPEYQWMPNGGDDTKVPVYGRLYTWYAATDSRNVCPANYRIPSQTDWNTLLNYLINNGYGYGGSGSGIGESMASASIEWTSDSIVGSVGFDLSSNNRSGFLAFPASVRQANGTVYNTGGGSWLWSSTQKTDGSVLGYYIDYNMTDLTAFLSYNGNLGFSIRCMKDALTDVNQLADSQIKLYPNPATDGIYIETGDKTTTVSVYTLNGILMLNKQVISKDFINISSFPKGMYLVKLITSEGTTERKIVKK
jgi:uncharacterized protein (TIGR02145 family)